MRTLTTLIKLHKRTLDELRRKMVSLENQKAQLETVIEKSKQDLLAEIALASQSPEMGNFFGGYAKRMKKRQEELVGEIKALDQQMLKLNDEISAAFSELKKYEIALENAKRRKQEEENRKETIAMDEIAGQAHMRKKD